MRYIELPHCYIARNPKAMSMSIAQMAVRQYQSEWVQSQLEQAAIEPVDFSPEIFLSVVNQVDEPTEEKPVYILVRNPVDKFISTCSMLNLTAEEGLNSDHPYFEEQSKAKFTKAFSYEKGLEDFLKAAKLEGEVPKVNVGKNKIKLTAAEQKLVEEKYKDDLTLWKGL